MGKRIEAESSVKNKTKKGTKIGVEYVCENMRTRLRFLFTKNIKIENSELLFTVEIKIENISVEEKILAGFTEIKTESKILDELNIKCRSFQIAELKKTGFTYEIWNPVWCKLK